MTPGTNRISFTVPGDALAGQTYARFRFSEHGVTGPAGYGSDGEVEDYAVEVESFVGQKRWIAFKEGAEPGSAVQVEVLEATPLNTKIRIDVPGAWISVVEYAGRTFSRVQFVSGEVSGLGIPAQEGQRGWYDFPAETGYPLLPPEPYRRAFAVAASQAVFPQDQVGAHPRTGAEMEELGIDPAGARPAIPFLRGFLAVSPRTGAEDLSLEVINRSLFHLQLADPAAPAGFQGTDQAAGQDDFGGYIPPQLVDEAFYLDFQGAYAGSEPRFSAVSGMGAFAGVQVRLPMLEVQSPRTLKCASEMVVDFRHLRGNEETDCLVSWDCSPYLTPSFEVLHAGAATETDPRAINQDVIDAVNEGRGQLLYRGHGSDSSWVKGWDGWSDYGDSWTASSHVSQLANSVYPIVYSIACQNNRLRVSDALGEEFLSHEQGGAVAYWGASVDSYTTENHERAKGIFRALYESGMTRLGPALAEAERISSLSCSSSDWDNNTFCYLLLGDPELSIKPPATLLDVAELFAEIMPAEEGIYIHVLNQEGLPMAGTLVNIVPANGNTQNGFTSMNGTVLLPNTRRSDIRYLSLVANDYPARRMVINPDQIDCFGASHIALGQAALGLKENQLVISQISSSGQDGVSIGLKQPADVFMLHLEPVNLTAAGQTIEAGAYGTEQGIGGCLLGHARLHRSESTVEVEVDWADSSAVPVPVQIQVHADDTLVGVAECDGHNPIASLSGDLRLAGSGMLTTPLCLFFEFVGPVSVRCDAAGAGPAQFVGNRILLAPALKSPASLNQFVLVAANPGPLVIQDEAGQTFRPRLRVERRGQTALRLAWDTPEASLEAASDLKGPWRRISGATSPFETELNQASQFYRLVITDLVPPWPRRHRLGLNFFAINENPSGFDSVSDVLDDLEDLGAKVMRQTTDHDVGLANVYSSGSYDFTDPDDLFDQINARAMDMLVIPTLFQYSKTSTCGSYPCWPDTGDKVSDPAVQSEVSDYVAEVASRYSGEAQYFEVGNALTQYSPFFTEEDYATVLQICRDAFDSVDPDIKMLHGGLSITDLNTGDLVGAQLDWLEGVVDALDAEGLTPGDYFDVINFHYYEDWEQLQGVIDRIQSKMSSLALDSKPIGLTEVGRAHAGSSDWETDPHEEDDSEDEQARDVFRKLSVAYGNDVALAAWHTHFCSAETANPASSFWGFGLRHTDGSRALAWYSYRLFAEELGDFAKCTPIVEGTKVWAYRFAIPFTPLGFGPYHYKWVIWYDSTGSALWSLDDTSASTVTVTPVIPEGALYRPDGSVASRFFISSTEDPSNLTLGQTPILVEDGILHWTP